MVGSRAPRHVVVVLGFPRFSPTLLAVGEGTRCQAGYPPLRDRPLHQQAVEKGLWGRKRYASSQLLDKKPQPLGTMVVSAPGGGRHARHQCLRCERSDRYTPMEPPAPPWWICGDRMDVHSTVSETPAAANVRVCLPRAGVGTHWHALHGESTRPSLSGHVVHPLFSARPGGSRQSWVFKPRLISRSDTLGRGGEAPGPPESVPLARSSPRPPRPVRHCKNEPNAVDPAEAEPHDAPALALDGPRRRLRRALHLPGLATVTEWTARPLRP